MLDCYVNGQRVYPDLDNKIEIVKSNAAIADVGTYSYEIVFDVSVAANAAAFAGINRLNYIRENDVCYLELRVDGRLLIKGAAIVLKVVGNKVSLQATEGELSAKILNSGKLVRDLDLGTFPNISNVSVITACNWSSFPEYEVCFPLLTTYGETDHKWGYGDSSEPLDPSGMFNRYLLNLYYNEVYNTTQVRMMQPYFLAVVSRVFKYFGYKVVWDDFLSYQDNECFKKLFVCVEGRKFANGSYYQVGVKWESLLPYWTVSEFFAEVKQFLNCAFVFDEMNMVVNVVSRQQICREGTTVVIPHSKILQKTNSFEVNAVEKQQDGDAAYISFGYNIESEDDYLKLQNIDSVIYDKCAKVPIADKSKYETDDYVIFEDLGNAKFVNISDKGWIQIMNFQDVIQDEYVDVKRMNIIPANSRLINFDFKDNKNNHMKLGMIAALVPKPIGENTPIFPSKLNEALNGGITYPTYSDKLHVAFKSETNTVRVFEDNSESIAYYCEGWSGVESFTNARYDKEQWADEDGERASMFYSLAPSRMAKFYEDTYTREIDKEYVCRFLFDEIPDATSIFLINGRRFACKELRVTVENGSLKKFIEGVFYALK